MKSILTIAVTVAAASPAVASQMPADGAPQAGPDALYCLRIEPELGSRIETVQCYTRAGWAAMDVDLDAEWAREGVRVIG